MSLRATLAALDDGALEAAASKGLVRRAHRDHEAGLAAVKAETAARVDLAVDGETVVLGQGGLAGATCSCPAQGLCRHILAAVIALRAPVPEAGAAPRDGVIEAGSDFVPAPEAAQDFEAELSAFSAADLVKAFGRAALRDAEAILAAASESGAPIAVEPKPRACLVRLPGQPEVRYVAGLGLAGMISKDPLPVPAAGPQRAGKARQKAMSLKALHAAAVLAVRRLRAGEAMIAPPAGADASAKTTGASVARPDDGAFLDAVTEALAEAARSGLATAPQLLEERLLDLTLSSRADALPRLAGLLRGIAEDLSERRARAATFEAGTALAAMARAYALVVALRGAGDDAKLRGAVRQSYEDRPALDIVGCGLELWRTPTGARGATAYCLATDGGAPRWYTVTLARAAGQDPFFIPRQAVRAEPVWGHSLETLAVSGFHLDAARATADGRLSLGTETRLTMGETTVDRLLELRPDLFVEEWGAIEGRLAVQVSPSLRATIRPVPLLLRPMAVAAVQFDALEQRAWLPLMDRTGQWLDLTIGGDADDTRLDAIVAMQADGVPRVLVALATRDAADIVLSPIAAIGQGANALRPFDLWTPPRPSEPARPGVLDRLKVGFGALMARPRAAESFAPTQRPDAVAALLARAEDEALALAELGGRMEHPARLETLGRLAVELDAAGLAPLGAILSRLAEASSRERPLRLLAFKHAVQCHASLSPRLPLVRRLA